MLFETCPICGENIDKYKHDGTETHKCKNHCITEQTSIDYHGYNSYYYLKIKDRAWSIEAPIYSKAWDSTMKRILYEAQPFIDEASNTRWNK